MSDEIKNPETVNAGEKKQAEASEEELSKVVGGVLNHSPSGPEDTLDHETYSRPFPPIRR
jgi:RNA:NAD 2'-phosphotransferase (TPT1/KptA family)